MDGRSVLYGDNGRRHAMMTEKAISEREGIARPILKGYRDDGSMREGVHWMRSPKGILYTEQGMERLSEVLKSDLEGEVVLEAKRDPDPQVLQVEKFFPRHPKLIQCRLESGESVLVKVRSSENYALRQFLLARPPANPEYRIWHRVGREPRWKGDKLV
tara:strand:+ start:113 stop:589 length:477 start_codon:yes stop_codon:yes gene_type:complete